MADTPVDYYESLNFNSPLTEATADEIVAELAATAPSHVIDVGCGWAELLLRLLAKCPDATGHGVDNDETLIERATTNAAARKLSSWVSFAPALNGDETADLVINLGAEHVFGTLAEAIAALHNIVKPHGRLLLGAQYWESAPSEELVAEMGEVPTLDELVDLAVAGGFRPLGLRTSTLRDWDHFEFGFLADWEQFVMGSVTSADAAQAQQAADEHRAGYLARRGVFGFAFLTLGRPA